MARTGALCADRPGGLLPGEGRLDPGGEEDLHGLRGAGGMPVLRAGARRTIRHLGWVERTGTPPPQARRGLIGPLAGAAGRRLRVTREVVDPDVDVVPPRGDGMHHALRVPGDPGPRSRCPG